LVQQDDFNARRDMSEKLRQMIARAAEQALDEIAEVHRGEYRPRIHVVKLGDSLESLQEIGRAAA